MRRSKSFSARAYLRSTGKRPPPPRLRFEPVPQTVHRTRYIQTQKLAYYLLSSGIHTANQADIVLLFYLNLDAETGKRLRLNLPGSLNLPGRWD